MKRQYRQEIIRTYLVIALFISLLFNTFPVQGVIIETGVEWEIDNETYTVNQTMNFSRIMTIDNITIVFNNTGFNVTAPNNILITLDYIDSDILNAIDGERVVGFYADTVGGDVWMNISGLRTNTGYNVYRDSVLFNSYTSNSTGSISIFSDSWSEHLFRIFATGNTAPVQSNPVPANGASSVSRNPSLGITVNDADGHTMNQTFRTNVSGSWLSIAWNNNTGNASLSNSTSVFDSYDTEYWWSSNTSDGNDGWDNDTYSFTIQSNTAPTLNNPSPGNGATGVSVGLASLSVDIADAEGTFNWTISTNPNIGSNSANDASDGTKTCNIAGLNYDAHYLWTVTAYDGIIWTNTTYDFTVESDPGGGPPPNSAPVISEEYPADESINIVLQPFCHVLVTDANIDTTDINFYNSTDGVTYYWSQKNSTVSTGTTVYWNYSQASSYDTLYYWQVTANDGTINVTYSFSFTTYPNNPVISSSSPTNNSVDITRNTSLSIVVYDYQGDSMDITWRSNSSGSWIDFGYNNSVGNGTYSQRFINATEYNTKYWWSVNISGSWTNATYSFTTELNLAPTITDPIPRNYMERISIYTANFSVVITDANSNFNYTIETFPDVGSISENNVGDGVKTVVVTGLNYSTTYTWYVNATDGDSTTRASYSFTTKSSTDFDIEGFKLNLPEWAVGPFKVYVGDFIWLIMAIGLIAITWGSSKHISSVFVVILLVFAAYGVQRVFVDNSEISLLFSVIAAICIAAVMLGLFLRKRQG